MKRSRVTLLGLMGVIAVIGLFLAAFRNPTPFVASIAWTGTLTVLIVAGLVAVLDRRRVFWIGFAGVGLVFAAFASTPVEHGSVELPLLTSHILRYLYASFSNVFPPMAPYDHSERYVVDDYAFRSVVEVRTFASFHRIGQAFAALIHALAGGLLALFLNVRLRRRGRRKSEL